LELPGLRAMRRAWTRPHGTALRPRGFAGICAPERTSMSTARKILIVDDDEDLRETLKDQLVLHDEFEVETAGTASK
jgi:hypothetical protein